MIKRKHLFVSRNEKDHFPFPVWTSPLNFKICPLLNCFFLFPLNKSDNKEMDTSFFLTADYNEINFKKASQKQWVRQL